MNRMRIVLALLSLMGATSSQADVNGYFNYIKTSPKLMYAFFKKMPKGGELHYHLAGGPSPEKMLFLVSKDDYCLKTDTFLVAKMELNQHCEGAKTNTIQKNSDLYKKVVQSWSMEEFVPGKESSHDHFFNTFMKFIPIVFNYRAQLLANVMQRAAAHQEHYLEIMDIPDNAQSISFGEVIKNASTFAERKKLLLNNKKFQNNVALTINESEQMLINARKELDCEGHPEKKACHIKIKLLYYVLREQPLDSFFAQALNAFVAVSRSKGSLVGVNLVQPEDGMISLRDYEQQMRIFNYLHTQYPQVHIALHAGEVTPEFVTKKELKYHIHDAVFIGKAQRIGHGVDITYENDAKNTLAYMVKHEIPVEVNLISNTHILNVSGPQHPLNYYLKHHVPVVLSTDDEGILRTDLTQQYVEAARAHHLDYQVLKQINRNTLTYAFVPGTSLWSNASTAERVSACQNLDSPSCKQFIAKSEKAQLQWELEKGLIAFEKQFS